MMGKIISCVCVCVLSDVDPQVSDPSYYLKDLGKVHKSPTNSPYVFPYGWYYVARQ